MIHRKIPATIITGFLGAGKTTLIRHMLENAQGRGIALIINEFGDLGVDAELLTDCTDAACGPGGVIELSNGCICCAVTDDFIPALQSLLTREPKPSHIVIETSGLALPQPLVRAFKWPNISTKITIDGVITVIDGEAFDQGRFAHNPKAIELQRIQDANLDHDTPLADLFDDQIACADMIIVNKLDLLAPDALKCIVTRLNEQTRDGVQVLTAQRGALPVDVLLGQNNAAENTLEIRREKYHHHHENEDHHDDHGHDAFESFVVERPEIIDVSAFTKRLSETISAHGILRLKGFAAVKGKAMRLILQGIGPRLESYFDRRLRRNELRGCRFVVIGRYGLNQQAITYALRKN